MVAMNSWSMTHFNEMFGLNQGLEASINLNRMPLSEVREALAIRHGATHKKLINQEGLEMIPSEFAKQTAEIYRLSYGNIGEALHLWACASAIVNEDEVLMNPIPQFELPDFIDADKGILLRALLQQKHSNEYQMLKQFGPAFNKRYKVIIQRLLSYGILKRQGNGQVSISPGVVNEVARTLAKLGQIEIPYTK